MSDGNKVKKTLSDIGLTAKLVQEGQAKGEIASQKMGGANIKNGMPEKNTVKTLSDIGLTAKQSHVYQKIYVRVFRVLL